MATFLMFGKYSPEAVKGISAVRTEKATALVKQLGGKIKSMYALLGQYDLVLVLEFPGIGEVMKFSVAVAKETGISFTTAPAVEVDEFDKLMG